MKNGIFRKVDKLGRVVIPREIRKILQINEGTTLDISIEKDGVFIRKTDYESCTICGQVLDKSDTYCRNCGKKLGKEIKK